MAGLTDAGELAVQTYLWGTLIVGIAPWSADPEDGSGSAVLAAVAQPTMVSGGQQSTRLRYTSSGSWSLTNNTGATVSFDRLAAVDSGGNAILAMDLASTVSLDPGETATWAAGQLRFDQG